MKIFITIPSFAVHGGIRVIMEWANYLAQQHTVYLRLLKGPPSQDWFELDRRVQITCNDGDLRKCDLMIVTSPHAVNYLQTSFAGRRFIFLQMLEHLFRTHDNGWRDACQHLYTSPHPMITISRWGIDKLLKEYGRRGPTYLVGNGVNLQHFPISNQPKDGKTVLVEGWVSMNASKDPHNYAPAVAKALRDRGYHIIAYSAYPNRSPYHAAPHEYFQRPTLPVLNSLYERATILVKASQYDFRSCAPMEAMTKGTVTARALNYGDDDLVHGTNCLRSTYNREHLLQNALRLLQDGDLRTTLAEGCLKHVQTYTWDYWFQIISSLLSES